MACLNNDKSVMSRPYACRVLGIMPILKAYACTNTDETWQRLRRLNLYHRCMDPVIAEINERCKIPRYYRWAHKLVRLGQAFWHIISTDGLEIEATALSSTITCPTCECPKDELDRTDKLYPVRSTADVRTGVELAVQSSWNGIEVSRIDALGRAIIIYDITYDIKHDFSLIYYEVNFLM